MDLVTLLSIKLKARYVGDDEFGNRYYQEKRARPSKQPRRYVRYNGLVEASKVPAEWHGWLHHTEDLPPPSEGYHKHAWQQEHLPNLTGTKHAHRPAGHVLRGGKRPAATGDYEPWTPS
jgi:NADH:ubiquinone oxidoreductase subunit